MNPTLLWQISIFAGSMALLLYVLQEMVGLKPRRRRRKKRVDDYEQPVRKKTLR